MNNVAIIKESDCIGCTKCINACPVDAIIGAEKHMHTVLTELCIGCKWCLPVCPTQCIEMVPNPSPDDLSRQEQAKHIKARRKLRQSRQAKELAQKKLLDGEIIHNMDEILARILSGRSS